MKPAKRAAIVRKGGTRYKTWIKMKPYVAIYKLKTFHISESRPKRKSVQASSPNDAAKVARAIYKTLDADKEHFAVLCMDQKNRLVGFKHVATGTLTNTLVHPREVFIAALELRAAALIFVHNHPSGDPAPSPEDYEITLRLKHCGELLGFRILDHIILGSDRHFSFEERRLIGEVPKSKDKRRKATRKKRK